MPSFYLKFKNGTTYVTGDPAEVTKFVRSGEAKLVRGEHPTVEITKPKEKPPFTAGS